MVSVRCNMQRQIMPGNTTLITYEAIPCSTMSPRCPHTSSLKVMLCTRGHTALTKSLKVEPQSSMFAFTNEIQSGYYPLDSHNTMIATVSIGTYFVTTLLQAVIVCVLPVEGASRELR